MNLDCFLVAMQMRVMIPDGERMQLPSPRRVLAPKPGAKIDADEKDVHTTLKPVKPEEITSMDLCTGQSADSSAQRNPSADEAFGSFNAKPDFRMIEHCTWVSRLACLVSIHNE
eukprot:scaffold156768_cov33-Prasinocladus_malaysianus.AAC.1